MVEPLTSMPALLLRVGRAHRSMRKKCCVEMIKTNKPQKHSGLVGQFLIRQGGIFFWKTISSIFRIARASKIEPTFRGGSHLKAIVCSKRTTSKPSAYRFLGEPHFCSQFHNPLQLIGSGFGVISVPRVSLDDGEGNVLECWNVSF